MIMLDNTVVNVALPSIQRSLHLKVSELEWVVAGYALTFGAFMLTGGKLADLLGRREMFVVGLVIFTAASLACGLAGECRDPDRRARHPGSRRRADEPVDALDHHRHLPAAPARHGDRDLGRRLGARARDRPARRRLITERLNWNWIFFINVPIGIVGGRRRLRVHHRVARHLAPSSGPTSPGSISSAIGLFALSYGADRGEHRRLGLGADPDRVRDRRRGAGRLRRARAAPAAADARSLALPQRTFSGANTVMLLVGLAMFGVFFYVSLYIQQILGYSPIQAGRALPADGRS